MSKEYLIALTKRLSSYEKDKQQSGHIGMHFDAHSIQCDKDLVCNGYIVSSQCEPNKIVSTNQHKQLVSANLTDVIRSNNLNIFGDNGNLLISTPQELNTTSEPTFKMVNITDEPVHENNIVTKKYIDERLSDIGSGIFNLDTSQIKLYSTIDSENASTGSFIISGGMGIAKNLYIGGGLHLPNSNGIDTALDYFEEGTLSISWDNIWDHYISSTFAYQRIGKWVMLMFPYISHTACKNGKIFNTSDSYLPLRLQPLYDITIDITGTNSGSDVPVCVTIFGDNGKILIKPKTSTEFTGSGICGFNTFSISYMAKI